MLVCGAGALVLEALCACTLSVSHLMADLSFLNRAAGACCDEQAESGRNSVEPGDDSRSEYGRDGAEATQCGRARVYGMPVTQGRDAPL